MTETVTETLPATALRPNLCLAYFRPQAPRSPQRSERAEPRAGFSRRGVGAQGSSRPWCDLLASLGSAAASASRFGPLFERGPHWRRRHPKRRAGLLHRRARARSEARTSFVRLSACSSGLASCSWSSPLHSEVWPLAAWSTSALNGMRSC